MKCSVCENTLRVKPGTQYVKCPKCGVATYEPNRKADLHRRKQVTFLDRIIAVLLFKLYDFTVWLNKKLEREVRKPRLGRL